MNQSQANPRYEGIKSQDLVEKMNERVIDRDYHEARVICCELLWRNPRQPLLRLRLRLVSFNELLGYKDEALVQMDIIIRNNPGKGELIMQKVQLLEGMGKFDEACDIVSKLRANGAEHPYFSVLEANAAYQNGDYDRAIELTQCALTDTSMPDEWRRNWLFRCGSAYDKLGEPDKAMEALQKANSLQPVPFRKDDFTGLADRLIELYSKENVDKIPRSTNMSDQPVFLVSMARSGTSLLNQIIDSHPLAQGVGETGYFVMRRAKVREELSDGYPQNMMDVTPDQLDAIAEGYLEGAGKAREDGVIRTWDKSIDNFRDLGFIWQTFPNARYIYLRRDPLDCCFSIYQHPFVSPNIAHYTSRLEDIGYVYKQHERLKAHWKEALGIPVLDVTYEDITSDAETQVARILQFLGLPWDDQCMKFYESKRGVNTLSQHQVTQPIYKDSVGKGEKYAKYMGDLKKVLGIEG